MSWSKELAKFLKAAERVVVLGIGNVQKGDDAAGAVCVELIAEQLKKQPQKYVKVINAGEVPENYTGDIRKFQATHIVIIDACINRQRPGTISLMAVEKIGDEDISTHRMPLSMLVKFLKTTINCEVLLIGIEPKSLIWKQPLSAPVQKAVDTISKVLMDLIR